MEASATTGSQAWQAIAIPIARNGSARNQNESARGLRMYPVRNMIRPAESPIQASLRHLQPGSMLILRLFHCNNVLNRCQDLDLSCDSNCRRPDWARA